MSGKLSPQAEQPESLPSKRMLDVPLIRQNPELKYGCEVTSLAMLLQYAGYDVDKLTLARQVPKDTEPLVQRKGDIRQWGDPNVGFVGDITGKRKGFAVYNKPLEKLLRRYMGERTLNLTGQPFERILQSVGQGRPVVVWTTGDFAPPTEWKSWQKDGKKVVAPFDEHAVLLVGYDQTHVYVNDPLSGVKQQRVSREAMKKSWEALGKQALTFK
ncbi:MAG: C39 family peptidase [Brevibacillus sp.]|nr:C39 family peptidase [Brevibacillus sp.]